jgi:hypothetical protein
MAPVSVMMVMTVGVMMTGTVRPRPNNTAARPLRERPNSTAARLLRERSNGTLAAAVTTSLSIGDKE